MNAGYVESPSSIRVDEHGVMRVGNTRVTIDTVVHAFKEGASAEEIQLRYEAVPLADIYGAIAHYLRNVNEIEKYLEDRERRGVEVRREIEARPGGRLTREQLLKRISRAG